MKLIVNDQLVTYSDEGTGKVILLLHGWGADLQTFDAMAAELKNKFRIIRIDFPGFGQSPRPTDDWHIDDYAHCVADFLRKLNVDEVYTVIGHSFGGRVILKAVGNDYLDPERVILMGSAGVKPDGSAKRQLYKLVAKAGKQATKLPGLRKFQNQLRHHLYKSAGSTDYLEAEAMRPIFLNTINEDLQADAAKIQQPTLLIWGANDDSTPVADGQTLQSVIEQSKLEVITGAGHFVYVDNYDAVMKLTQDFIS